MLAAWQREGVLASMEPLFFKAENGRHGRWNSRPVRASMEPLFFKAENNAGEKDNGTEEDWLQWSRFFSKRKIVSSKNVPR